MFEDAERANRDWMLDISVVRWRGSTVMAAERRRRWGVEFGGWEADQRRDRIFFKKIEITKKTKSISWVSEQSIVRVGSGTSGPTKIYPI